MMEVKLVVNGKKVTVDLVKELEINDINEDMSKIAAKMAYWSTICGAADAEKMTIDALYRKWRASIGKQLLEKDVKVSEWKVKQAIESNSKFEDLKRTLSVATNNVVVTRGIYESFRVKSSMLQSKGAMARYEMDSTGMSTPDSDMSAHKSKMKKENSRKKASTSK